MNPLASLFRSTAVFLIGTVFLLPLRGYDLADFRAEVQTILARPAVANNTWSILLENEWSTTTFAWDHSQTVMRPASVTKLFTTAAAFALLGEDHRFETRLYHTGTLSNGILTGDLHLISEHDFTVSTDFYANTRVPYDQMAARLRQLGLREVRGNVIARGVTVVARVFNNAEAAILLRQALINHADIPVSGSATAGQGFHVTGTPLHTHVSVPLRDACVPLNRSSHNAYADALLRHLGWRLSGSDTHAAGEARVIAWMDSAGINTVGFRIFDGSGLNYSNRISAEQATDLLRHMRRHYPSFENTLARGCGPGTLSSRFCGTDGAGRVFAKTGTLPNGLTVSLAGYVKNPHDGRIYDFAMLANNATDVTATRRAIDDVVLLLTRANLTNAGPLPEGVTVVDNVSPGFSTTGTWNTGQFPGGHRFNYRWSQTTPTAANARAIFRPDLELSGIYDLFVWFPPGGNRAADVQHLIHHREGVSEITLDQTSGEPGWRPLATNVPLNAGAGHRVEVTNVSTTGDRVAIADAVRWERVSYDGETPRLPPLLHYTLNETTGGYRDRGAFPGLVGQPTGGYRMADTPGASGGRSFATGPARARIGGTGDHGKLAQLESFTLTAWINLRSAPAHGQRLLSLQDTSWNGFSWGINQPAGGGTAAVDRFALNLFVGGENGFSGQVSTENVNAGQRWVFLAVTYLGNGGANNTRFYIGAETTQVAPLGEPRTLGSGPTAPGTGQFRVGSTSATTASTTPDAWFDDIRVYGNALSMAELESVRREGLQAPIRTFAHWRWQHFPEAERDDDVLSGPLSQAADGAPYLLRHALGLAPGHPIPAGMSPRPLPIEGADGQRRAALFFHMDPEATDITALVEVSENLVDWHSAGIRIEELTTDNGPGGRMAWDDSTETDRRFLRVRYLLKARPGN